MVPSRWNIEIAASFPSATDEKKFSNFVGAIAREITPRNSPFGPMTLRAITVLQPPEKRLRTSSTCWGSGPDFKGIKKAGGAMLMAGTTDTSDELIRVPPAS